MSLSYLHLIDSLVGIKLQAGNHFASDIFEDISLLSFSSQFCC